MSQGRLPGGVGFPRRFEEWGRPSLRENEGGHPGSQQFLFIEREKGGFQDGPQSAPSIELVLRVRPCPFHRQPSRQPLRPASPDLQAGVEPQGGPASRWWSTDRLHTCSAGQRGQEPAAGVGGAGCPGPQAQQAPPHSTLLPPRSLPSALHLSSALQPEPHPGLGWPSPSPECQFPGPRLWGRFSSPGSRPPPLSHFAHSEQPPHPT